MEEAVHGRRRQIGCEGHLVTRIMDRARRVAKVPYCTEGALSGSRARLTKSARREQAWRSGEDRGHFVGGTHYGAGGRTKRGHVDNETIGAIGPSSR